MKTLTRSKNRKHYYIFLVLLIFSGTCVLAYTGSTNSIVIVNHGQISIPNIYELSGSAKDIQFKWVGDKEVTDYFKYQIKVESLTLALSDVEINQGGKKIKSNKGDFEIKLKANLIKDYDGKFETSSRMKMWRAVYEKWIIPARIKQFEDHLAGKADEFLAQVKAFLDINGQR